MKIHPSSGLVAMAAIHVGNDAAFPRVGFYLA
jgi:hypothetical protein